MYCYAVSALSNCRDLHVIFVGEYIYSDNSLNSGSILSLKRATLSSLHKGIMWTSGRAGTMGDGEEHILSKGASATQWQSIVLVQKCRSMIEEHESFSKEVRNTEFYVQSNF